MIYLDNNSTTPIDEKVLNEMLPYFTTLYGNASSNHKFGISANEGVKKARKQVAKLLGCDANEIIFTSGATESINLAIKGISESYKNRGKHIITVKTEHSAVLDVCRFLEKKDFEVTYLPVLPSGLLDLDQLKRSIRKDTILISVMHVNNETGVIQPIEKIIKIAKEYDVLFMTDATQSVGKLPINVRKLGIDILALSGHKIYGPKGVGALYLRNRGKNRVKLSPVFHGGGHERGLRSGTLNVPLIIGLGKVCDIALQEMDINRKKIKKLRDFFEEKILNVKDIKVSVNGNSGDRLYNVSNLLFHGIDADAIMVGLEDIFVSNGSACTSNSVEPSHVLTAMGLSSKDAYSCLRVSFGKQNNLQEIKNTIDQLVKVISELNVFNS